MGRKWLFVDAGTASKVGGWFAARRKAFAALIVPIAAFLTAHGIFNIDSELAALIATILAGGATYAVPNTPDQEG